MFRPTLLRPARILSAQTQPARRALHQHANPERSFAEAFLFMTGCLTLGVGAGKLLWAAGETVRLDILTS